MFCDLGDYGTSGTSSGGDNNRLIIAGGLSTFEKTIIGG